MRIRRAEPDDAAALAEVHVRSWQATYRGVVPQDYLDTLDPTHRIDGWTGIVAGADWPRRGTLVAEDARGVVGFAAHGASRDDDHDVAPVGEIYAVYSLPRVWGAGVGRLLMGEALRTMGEAEYRQATLWVLDTNRRARQFYAAGGWVADGATRVDDERGFPLNEVRYRRPISVR